MTSSESELLQSYRGWLITVASGMTHGHHNVEDLAAEGWIEIWRAWARGETDAPWLKVCALNRMRNVVRDSKAKKRQLDTYPPEWLEWLDTQYIIYEGLELAYHTGQLKLAMRYLTCVEMEYVYLRFYQDRTFQELNRHFNTKNSAAIWQRIKKKLAMAVSYAD